MKPYQAYFFRPKEQDPVVDKVRTIIDDANVSLSKVSTLSGVSRTTLDNWDKGKTLRPQFCTVMAVVRALGHDVQFVPTGATLVAQKRSAKRGVMITKRSFNNRRAGVSPLH